MIPAITVLADELMMSWESIDRVTGGLVMLNEMVDIVLFILEQSGRALNLTYLRYDENS